MGTVHATAYQAWAMLQLGHREAAARLAREALLVPHADPSWPPTLTALITLGVAIAREQPDEAVGHLHRASELAREDGHRHNEAWCLNCLGVALRQMGRYEEALASHRQAFALLDELFEHHSKIHFLNGYAETCRLAGLPDEALRLHKQVLELAPGLGNRLKEACGCVSGRGGWRRTAGDPAARAYVSPLLSQPLIPASASGPLAEVTSRARSATETPRRASRQATSAAAMARLMAQGAVQACGGAASGPRWRISVQTNAEPGPSTASTTSSTVISAGSRVRR